MGRRPLNIEDVMIWCAFHGIENVDFRRWLWFFIHRLDSVWLELAEQEDERRRQEERLARSEG